MSFISLHTIPVALLNTLQYCYSPILIISLFIFWKYIYLAAHISKHLFLHFCYTISYTLTTPLHITHHNSSKLHSHALLLWNSIVLLPITYLNTLLHLSYYSYLQMPKHIFILFSYKIFHLGKQSLQLLQQL